MKKKKNWVVFYHDKQELAAISVQCISPGEIPATIGLLAYENSIPEDAIHFKVEARPAA